MSQKYYYSIVLGIFKKLTFHLHIVHGSFHISSEFQYQLRWRLTTVLLKTTYFINLFLMSHLSINTGYRIDGALFPVDF